MSTPAAWWNPADNGGKPVVRHAPDTNHYHYADERMVGRMPGGAVGRFAVIPAAARDGSSLAFDASMPGVVHVDPDAPDGGTIVDLTQVRAEQVEAAVAASTYPHEAFYRLGTPAARHGYHSVPQPQQERTNSLLPPGSYLVPRADIEGRQVLPYPMTAERAQEEQRVDPVPQLPSLAPVAGALRPVSPVAAPAPYAPVLPPNGYGAGYAPYVPPPLDPNLQNVLSSLAQGLSSLQQRLQAMEMRPPPPLAPPVLATLPQAPPPQQEGTYDDPRPIPRIPARARNHNSLIEQDQRDRGSPASGPRNGEVTGFEALGLTWVNGPIGNKPRRRVIFELPGMGKQAAWFHEVSESENCVVLTYDTRYEDGYQYLPPDLNDNENQQLRLHVPDLKKTFTVGSLGLTCSLGVFDQIVLVKQEVESLSYAEQ